MRLAARHFRHEDVESALDARVLLATEACIARGGATHTAAAESGVSKESV
jgi:hypothetical protein